MWAVMRERLVSPAVIKIAVIVLAIKELWLLLGIPAFSDALISFLMVGAVPGTDRSLTPDEMYKLLFGVFVLLVALVFRKEIMQLIRRMRTRNQGVMSQVTIPAAMPLAHPLAPKAQRVRIGLPAVMRPVLAKASMLSLAALTASRQVASMVLHISSVILRLILRVVTLIVIAAVNALVVAWRMAEPYLRRFDAWLERKLHEYELTKTLLSIGSEMGGTARRWTASAKAAYDEASTPRQTRKQ
jgi:hypothetical protein